MKARHDLTQPLLFYANMIFHMPQNLIFYSQPSISRFPSKYVIGALNRRARSFNLCIMFVETYKTVYAAVYVGTCIWKSGQASVGPGLHISLRQGLLVFIAVCSLPACLWVSGSLCLHFPFSCKSARIKDRCVTVPKFICRCLSYISIAGIRHHDQGNL